MRSRCVPAGTPRIANRLFRRVRDFAQVLNDGVISKAVAAMHWTVCGSIRWD